MAKRRTRKKPVKDELENEVLSRGRWSGLDQQDRLIALNHTEAENQAARDECRALRQHGYTALSDYISWVELTGHR